MKELTRESLLNIRDIIQNQNYTNIKARLDQWLPKEYSQTFAGIILSGNYGIWFGDDGIDYKNYAEASDVEREEIAIWLEECREQVKSRLASKIDYTDKLFAIPSKDNIFWHRNSAGQIRVALTSWGFLPRNAGSEIDVIGFLISEPRVITQTDVNVHIQYSDGLPACDTPFVVEIFNNRVDACTNDKGDHSLGKMYAGKKFAVESATGKNRHEFVVAPDGKYVAVFDYEASYEILAVNQFDQPKPNITLKVNGIDAATDGDGKIAASLLLKPDSEIVVSFEGKELGRFMPKRDADENKFKVVINDPEPKKLEPPMPPKPQPKKVTVRLLDFDGSPLPELPFSIFSGKIEVAKGVTDDKGEALVPADMMVDKKKYRIKFQVSKQYREKHNKTNTTK